MDVKKNLKQQGEENLHCLCEEHCDDANSLYLACTHLFCHCVACNNNNYYIHICLVT